MWRPPSPNSSTSHRQTVQSLQHRDAQKGLVVTNSQMHGDILSYRNFRYAYMTLQSILLCLSSHRSRCVWVGVLLYVMVHVRWGLTWKEKQWQPSFNKMTLWLALIGNSVCSWTQWCHTMSETSMRVWFWQLKHLFDKTIITQEKLSLFHQILIYNITVFTWSHGENTIIPDRSASHPTTLCGSCLILENERCIKDDLSYMFHWFIRYMVGLILIVPMLTLTCFFVLRLNKEKQRASAYVLGCISEGGV